MPSRHLTPCHPHRWTHPSRRIQGAKEWVKRNFTARELQACPCQASGTPRPTAPYLTKRLGIPSRSADTPTNSTWQTCSWTLRPFVPRASVCPLVSRDSPALSPAERLVDVLLPNDSSWHQTRQRRLMFVPGDSRDLEKCNNGMRAAGRVRPAAITSDAATVRRRRRLISRS